MSIIKTNKPIKKKDSSKNQPLSRSLENNVNAIACLFQDDTTLKQRHFNNGTSKPLHFCALYLDGMIDTKSFQYFIKSLRKSDLTMDQNRSEFLDRMRYLLISNARTRPCRELHEIVRALLDGCIILLIDSIDEALCLSATLYQKRELFVSESETSLQGPVEGFSEDLTTNITLIRRKINNPLLKCRMKLIGSVTKTSICICYLAHLAHREILLELDRRLNSIDIDGILDSGYIQELICDHPYSPFETIGSSEKPDVVASKLLEGRVAILVDGSPFVLTIPFILAEMTQSSDDYYANFIFASFNRFMRGISTLASILIPALYLSIVIYHPEILPTPIFLSIVASNQGIPFPTWLSLFVSLITFDILRETTTRMVPHVGAAMSFVGTLILGRILIDARITSAPVVIITGLTGILTLLNMKMSTAILVVRYVLMAGASLFGIYGTIILVLGVLLHLMTLRSFGIPYFMNLSRIDRHNFQDAWVRAPWSMMKYRPKLMGSKNKKRQAIQK